MSRGPLRISSSDLKMIRGAISEVEESGAMIRRSFGKYNDDDFDIGWEVDAAVDALEVDHRDPSDSVHRWRPSLQRDEETSARYQQQDPLGQVNHLRSERTCGQSGR